MPGYNYGIFNLTNLTSENAIKQANEENTTI